MKQAQAELFLPDARGVEHPHLADALPCRRLDPRSSEDAAVKVAPKLSRRRQETLNALRAWEGEPPTTQELAQGNLALRFEYARRMSELARRNLVRVVGRRRCKVSHEWAQTWEVIS